MPMPETSKRALRRVLIGAAIGLTVVVIFVARFAMRSNASMNSGRQSG